MRDELGSTFSKMAERMVTRLMKHRERYLRAWCAATGIHPAQAMLIERTIPGEVMTNEVRVVPADDQMARYWNAAYERGYRDGQNAVPAPVFDGPVRNW